MSTDVDVRADLGGHVVLLYRDSDDLAALASSFLVEAIKAGGAALVIGTPAHRQAIERDLSLAGADVASSSSASWYRAVDAGDVLDRVLVGERPDPASFWQVIAPLLRAADRAGKPVHVYGELVWLLWRDGLVNAAVEVEAMWNELRAQIPFRLLCGYRETELDPARHSDAVSEVYASHTKVIFPSPNGRAEHRD